MKCTHWRVYGGAHDTGALANYLEKVISCKLYMSHVKPLCSLEYYGTLHRMATNTLVGSVYPGGCPR